MRAMKDSGVEWLGQVPAGWSVAPGKRILTPLQRPVRDDDGVVTCFRDGEVTLRTNRRTEGFTVALKEIGYQGIEPGDLVVHGMDGFAGSIGISDSRGKASPVLNVLDSDQDKRFLMYYMRGLAYRDVYMALSDGIRVRSCNLSWKKISNLMFALPDRDEQSRIADFLDAKCAEVDRAVSAAEQSIQEYKAYKNSVVFQAVTKGLDPDAPMKDSGVEWLGPVPSNWKIIPSKTAFYESKQKRLSGDERLTPSQNYGVVTQSEYMRITGSKIVLADKGLDDWKHVEPLDFIISLRSFQGGLEMSRVSGCVTWHYIVLRSKIDVHHDYFRFLFKSVAYIDGLRSTCQYLRDGQDLRYSNFVQVPLPLPPLDDQRRIADFLDAKCAEIDRIVEAKQAIIDELKSYKQSLIYEAVTGKLEV